MPIAQKYEIERASFQRPSMGVFLLFQKFNEAGSITFLASDFRGKTIDEQVTDHRASFDKWMTGLINASLKASL